MEVFRDLTAFGGRLRRHVLVGVVASVWRFLDDNIPWACLLHGLQGR